MFTHQVPVKNKLIWSYQNLYREDKLPEMTIKEIF